MIIRKATHQHLQAITAIYNHAIENTFATFDTVIKTLSDRTLWFDNHTQNYPILVCEVDNKIVGWASLSRWSDKAAYDGTAEISIYFSPQNQGNGLGNELLKQLLTEARNTALHTIIARISHGNDVSIHLHKKYGFELTGTLKQVGYKFNQYIDVHMMQLMLK